MLRVSVSAIQVYSLRPEGFEEPPFATAASKQSVMDYLGFYSPRLLPNEARRIGLGILSQDIPLSGEGFMVEEDGEALGASLRYYKRLSEKAILSTLHEKCKRSFSSVAELYQRTIMEKNALENLVKAGWDLREVLFGARIPAPQAVVTSGAFLWPGRRDRRRVG